MVVALVAMLAAAQAPAESAPGKMTQREFKRLAAASKVVIVDVRNASNFRDGHIPRAISLPFDGTPWSAAYDEAVETLKAAAKPVVVYCACKGETQALNAAYKLSEHGLSDVRVLVGGWNDWFNNHNRVARGPK